VPALDDLYLIKSGLERRDGRLSPSGASSWPAPSCRSGAGTLVGMQQLGFALAFGVLLDTFVVRPLLVPAYLVMLYQGRFGIFQPLSGRRSPRGPKKRPRQKPAPRRALMRSVGCRENNSRNAHESRKQTRRRGGLGDKESFRRLRRRAFLLVSCLLVLSHAGADHVAMLSIFVFPNSCLSPSPCLLVCNP